MHNMRATCTEPVAAEGLPVGNTDIRTFVAEKWVQRRGRLMVLGDNPSEALPIRVANRMAHRVG
jgi:hypothetical protein